MAGDSSSNNNASSSSSSSRFLSRLLSFSSSRHSSNNNDIVSHLKNEGNDDCIDEEEEEEEAVLFFDNINDDVTTFSSARDGNGNEMKRQGSNNTNKFYLQTAESFNSTVSSTAAAATATATADNMETIIPSIYDLCDNIDDCMSSLYADIPAGSSCSDNDTSTVVVVPPITKSIQSNRTLQTNNNNIPYDYDWILDGDPPRLPIKETDTAASRRRRRFGDDKLDLMLGMLEIENQEFEFVSYSDDDEEDDDIRLDNASSVVDDNGEAICNNGEGVKGGEGVVYFADFSKLELDQGRKSIGGNEEDEFGSFTDTPHEDSTVGNIGTEIAAKEQQQQQQDVIQKCESGLSYEPPESIGCLVNDITTQLDTTIDECLATSADSNSVGSQNLSESQDDPSASEHLLNQITQSDTILLQRGGQNYGLYSMQQQSLLMSAVLLESLPVPIATETIGEGDDALIASLTRRIQRQHQVSVAAMNVNGDSTKQDGDDMISSSQIIDQEDVLLEQALSDVIHPGYFEETENDVNDEHYFDSIVMEEILTVPWPFHEITDINEPLFGEGVFDSSDSDNSDDEHGFDTLNFDTYISNRLSQLHQASAQVVTCLHKRASEREESINKGIQSVFATEIDIETALLFAKSSREFLHRAIHGYPVSDGGGKQKYLHNAVSGSLDVLEYSDCRDRLGLLLVTLDQMSSIHEEEANWWKQLSDQRITTDKIPSLVEGVRRLKQLTVLEETLTRLDCTKEMNERINKLPGVLICLIEEILAGLFDRILSSDETTNDRFGGYFKEYQTLLQTWIVCVELRDGEHPNAMERCSVVSTEWSGCILDVLCFAVKKAVAYSMIDSFSTSENETASDRDLDLIKEIRGKLKRIRFRSKDESDLESLSQKLLLMRVGGIVRVGGTFNCTALSLTFFHLSSRLVELLSFYEVTCQWHEAMLANEGGTQESDYFADEECDQDGSAPSCSKDILLSHASISMVSSNETSSNDASEDETSVETKPVPSRISFKENKISRLDWFQTILQSVGCIRRALWKYCEESLINLVESFSSDSMDFGGLQSGQGVDSATSSLHLTYDVFQQFEAFSKHFNGDTADDALCDTLKSNLWKLYRTHLRSVHIEAMKSTGSLLRQESWQLSPINISRSVNVADSKNDQEVGALYEVSRLMVHRSHQRSVCFFARFLSNSSCVLRSAKAVKELLMKASHDLKSSCSFNVTTRSHQRGYKYCISFVNFVQSIPDSSEDQGDEGGYTSDYFGACSAEFCSAVSTLIERSPCGELTLTLLSTSSADGLLKWAALLLAIGNNLPLVFADATKAIMTLFDLYFLTVFRICASSRTNEDVLVGLGRGSSVQSLSPSLMSVTMEADACAPLPYEGEGFATLQRFIQNSRKRLDRMVNLDKFQSIDQLSMSGSPVNQHKTAALRLEKESAAAFSCLIVAIVADVTSDLCNAEDMDISNDEEDVDDNVKESLLSYAQEVISMAPVFVKQSCYLSAARSLSGKELIFKVICCGKAWTNNSFQEYSNDYVDDLCERASLLWGHIASRGRLPTPAQRLMWDLLVRSSFVLLLEGFSKITTCSTEGRSLMSMDLATLSTGLAHDSVKERLDKSFPNISLPPSQSRREDSMRYVDTWIKVFFFPDDDAMNWIKQNKDQYHLDHSISLIAAKIPPKSKQMLASKKRAVVDIYNGVQVQFL